MSVWLSFKKSKIDWSYGNRCWREMRLSILKSFLMFLKIWVSMQTFIEGETFEWDFCEKLKDQIEQFEIIHQIEDLSFINSDKLDLTINIILLQKYIEPLACFGFLGIYTLINKSHAEAYFSCGNSRDIYDLLETINDYLDKDKINNEIIMNAKIVFKHSYESGEVICIS